MATLVMLLSGKSVTAGRRITYCQSALEIDPLSACNLDPSKLKIFYPFKALNVLSSSNFEGKI
jgi:hypothetical protein